MMRIVCDPRFFPSVLIVLDLFACCRWAWDGDWRRAVYWLAAAVLTTTVTW